MAEIKLQYEEMVGISNRMSTQAKSFENNHIQLKSSVATLGSNFSGRIPNIMLEELNNMNKSVNQVQQTLASLATLALQAATALKEVDEAAAAHINKDSGAAAGGGSGASQGQSTPASSEHQKKIDELLAGKYANGTTTEGVDVGHNARGCMGFAKNFLGDLYGINNFVPRNWPRVAAGQVREGDYVRYQSSDSSGITNHSIVITKVEGNTVMYVDYSGGQVNHKDMLLSQLEALIAKPLSSTYGTNGPATKETGNGYISRYPG